MGYVWGWGGLVFPAGQSSRERRRRRHLRASVFALALPLSLGPGWAIWTAIPKASTPVRGPQRRLLGSLLQVRLSVCRYGIVQVSFPSLLVYLLGALGEGEGSCHWKRNLLEVEEIALGLLLLGMCAQSLHIYSCRKIRKSSVTCWVPSLPLAPGHPGSLRSPIS